MAEQFLAEDPQDARRTRWCKTYDQAEARAKEMVELKPGRPIFVHTTEHRDPLAKVSTDSLGQIVIDMYQEGELFA